MPKKLKRPLTKKPAPPLPEQNDIWFSAPVRDPVRIPSRLWSFDRAVGGGLVLRTITEISGYEFVGKSSLGSHLLGLLPGEVAVLPLEAYDPQYLLAGLRQAGFRGSIWEVPTVDDKGKIRDDEAMLDALIAKLEEETTAAALLDSVGAISPVAEEEGSVREANMGRRARVMGPFMRKCERTLLRKRISPALVFLVNHAHPNIGVPGSNTSGGKAIHFHSATRIRLSTLEKFDDGSRIVEGKIIKLRFRGISREGAVFHVLLKAGIGVHPGLTAVNDCLMYGIAEKTRQGRVKLGDKDYGYLTKMILDDWQDPELFQPFHTALENYEE